MPEILATYPHDTDSFTQGLLIRNGRVFESSGGFGSSSLREAELSTGKVLRNQPLSEAEVPNGQSLFAEGLALVGDRTLVQLTWQAGLAFVWDLETFDQTGRPTQTFNYGPNQEGWGLCALAGGAGSGGGTGAASRLVMSDGSSQLQFRDPTTFESVDQPVSITRDGQAVHDLNELECVAGQVWANVWLTDEIVRIDPASGQVTAVVDASELRTRALAGCGDDSQSSLACPADLGNAVLNGIAYDASRDVFLLTGKLWPLMFEVRFVPAAG